MTANASAPRRLVVNADDFGFTRDVNRGILEAHVNGILTAATTMANGPAFDDAVRIARENPSLDIGCHLVLVGGCSVLPGRRPNPTTVSQLLAAIALRRIRVYDELRAQVDLLASTGIPLTHLDTHKHTHLFPPVLDAVARIAEEYGIRWVRRPLDYPMETAPADVPWSKRAVSRGFGFLRRRFHRVLSRHGCRTTDSFAGFQITGRFHTRELGVVIRHLPPGSTEFMCHPGYCTDELRAARTRLKESRQKELEALTAKETREALAEARVELVSYRDL